MLGPAPVMLAAASCLLLAACGSHEHDTAGAVPTPTPTSITVTMPSDAMLPTLSRGIAFPAQPVTDYHGNQGDVVVFRAPRGWAREGGAAYLVRRVIGTPGDTVVCCDEQGRIEVDDHALDEGYLAPRTAQVLCDGTEAGNCDWTSGTVPDHMVFVMGDNRPDASDSASHLCVSSADACPGEFVRESSVYAVTQ